MEENLKYRDILDFYKGKIVFITGNTGFKGSWLTWILISAGASVYGYSLEPPTDPSLFNIIGLDRDCNLKQSYGDVRDIDNLIKLFNDVNPEIVFHLAAQPIVRDSYRDPVGTYSTNVMGTVNVCEAVRQTESVQSFLNVTTDKVYKNSELGYMFDEDNELDGYDPYSNSKSCSELVTHSYYNSFLKDVDVAVSTARAGNVIGGGDFGKDRIVPDCIRAISSDGIINVRNPHSVRPYQHVLEPLFAYLLIASRQYVDKSLSGNYNVGPVDEDCVTTGDLVTKFCDVWNDNIDGENMNDVGHDIGSGIGRSLSWTHLSDAHAPHEANCLRLDCSKMKRVFGWHPSWHIDDCISETVNWTRVWLSGADASCIRGEMEREIEAYLKV